jgi:hypothetical protein
LYNNENHDATCTVDYTSVAPVPFKNIVPTSARLTIQHTGEWAQYGVWDGTLVSGAKYQYSIAGYPKRFQIDYSTGQFTKVGTHTSYTWWKNGTQVTMPFTASEGDAIKLVDGGTPPPYDSEFTMGPLGGASELSNITDIRSLYYGKLALDSNGDVWQWGTLRTGSTAWPTKQTGLDSITIIGIGTGFYTAYAWDAAGTIYSIGRGTEGQLGNGANVDQDSTWQTVTSLQGKTIYGIYGAGYSVFAHTSDGVYACGQGTNGRLGMGNSDNLNVFTKSTALSALSIYKMDFGHGSGYIITTDGKGYALGVDSNNSIPTPLSGDKNVPTEASSLTNLSLVPPPPPSLTYDTSNKLSIENLTPTSTILTDPNGSSFDIGTASNVYIRDSGTYSIASKDANTFLLASNTVTGTPTGTTYVYDSNTFTTPSQTYDTTKTITVSNVPSHLSNVVGNIYKGSTAYTIHATTSSSNVIIKNMGTYVSVFTTATQAFLTNAVNVNATPESDDNTIEDAAPLATTTTTTSTSTSIDITLAFHYGSFDTVYGDVDVTEAANNGHIFDDTPEGTYDWGTLDSTPSTASNQTTYTWTPSGTITADVLMVAGGGGGGGESSGGNSPGGGGGGGIVFIQNQNISEQQTIIVGDGGPGGSGSVNGSFGGDSSAFGTSAWGGGGGAKGDGNAEAPINNGQYGGGGGGSGNGNSGGAPATVQGNKGGNGPGVDGSSDGLLAGGGGGGNVQGGGNGGNGGDGGNYLSIFGTLYGENGVFSGGGAGGNANNGNTLRYGGSGGGGNGGNSNQGGSGQAHTGGGGAASWGASGTNSGGRGGSGIVLLKFIEIITTTTTTTGGIAGSTAVPTETTTDAPSVTLDATDTTVTDPTLDLDFTTTLPRTLKRYNNITSSSIGARFNRRESRKKRIEKSINADTFSIELTANNASSPTTLTVTVANSKFVINGDETPTLGFIRGETYTFDQSDVSNSGHPLVLVTSEDGATQYTTGWTASGTPGTDGSHAFIVPYDVPDTIYYKCTNHSNMGGEINTTFGNVFSLGDFTVAANTHVSGEYTLATNYDGTTSNLYVNGSLITQTTPSPAISAGIKDFILGKEFDGYVKNFTFWNYITVSPTITLSGDNPQSISGSYTELGASAVDQFGNSVSVVIDSSNVDTATAGTYYVTYTATGTNGVRGSVTRQVVVLAQVDQTFSYTGSLQTWTAPADMTVQVQMKGGSGGGWSFTPPGIGGWITFDINVIGGRTYDVVVGGNGASVSGGDSTKGGSGGGASGFGYNGTWYAIAGGGGGQDSAKTQNRNGGVPFSWNGQGSNGGTTTAARGNASGHNGGNGGNGSRAGGYGVGTGGGGSSGNSYGGGGGGWFGGGGGRPSSGGSTYYDSNYVDLSTIVATQPSVQFKITNVNKLT